MVRKGGNSAVSRRPPPATTGPPALPFGALGPGENGINGALKRYGIEDCPQCKVSFNASNSRPVQDSCGHFKCRTCFITVENCPQCNKGAENKRSRRSDAIHIQNVTAQIGGTIITEENNKAGPRVYQGSRKNSRSSPVSSSPSQKLPIGNLVPSPNVNPHAATSRSILISSTDADFPKGKISGNGNTQYFAGNQAKSNDTQRNHISKSKSTPNGGGRTMKESPNSSPVSSSPITTAVNQNGNSSNLKRGKLNKRTTSAQKKQSTSPTDLHSSFPFSADSTSTDSLSKPYQATVDLSSLTTSLESTSVNMSPRKPIQNGTGVLKESKSAEHESPRLLSVFHRSRQNEENSVQNITKKSKDISIPRSFGENDLSSSSSNPNSTDSDVKPDLNLSGDERREKKKKKRNPVVIHDHITVISGNPTMFQCNVCMKKFKTKAHIKYHEFCQNGTKPFKCEECGQGFIAKSHYEYHLRTHTGERPYVCPKCGKGFNQRGKVTRHMRSHTGEKPFICNECGRGFANAQALRSHHLIHTGERPFACKFCNKRFTGMTNLKKHIITHTGERPYVCTHCNKSFGLKWTLDLHLRTHSSERPFACELCTRAFSNSKDLRRHLVIHSGERPFKCWICGTAFRRKDNLDRHIKNTHNQPKAVAKQLANEAAAEYLAKNKTAPVPASKVNSAVISSVIKIASFPPSTVSAAPRGNEESDADSSLPRNNCIENEQTIKEAESKASDENSMSSNVIITAQLSPKRNAQDNTASESYDMTEHYILPDTEDSLIGFATQNEVERFNSEESSSEHVLPNVTKLRSLASSDCGIRIFDELSNVPAPETDLAHLKSELLDTSEPGLMTTIQVPVLTAQGSNPILQTIDKFEKQDSPITITVVYENDGKTHFITETHDVHKHILEEKAENEETKKPQLSTSSLSPKVEQKLEFASIPSSEAAENQDIHLTSLCHDTEEKEVEPTNISCDIEEEYDHELTTNSSVDEDVEQVFVEEKETQKAKLSSSPLSPKVELTHEFTNIASPETVEKQNIHLMSPCHSPDEKEVEPTNISCDREVKNDNETTINYSADDDVEQLFVDEKDTQKAKLSTSPLSPKVEQKHEFTSIASPEAAEKQNIHLTSPCHSTEEKEVEPTNISYDMEEEYDHELTTNSSADENVEQVLVEEKETQKAKLSSSPLSPKVELTHEFTNIASPETVEKQNIHLMSVCHDTEEKEFEPTNSSCDRKAKSDNETTINYSADDDVEQLFVDEKETQKAELSTSPLSPKVEQKHEFASIASPEAVEKQEIHLTSPCHSTEEKEVEPSNISYDMEEEYDHELTTNSSADDDVEQMFVEEKETQKTELSISPLSPKVEQKHELVTIVLPEAAEKQDSQLMSPCPDTDEKEVESGNVSCDREANYDHELKTNSSVEEDVEQLFVDEKEIQKVELRISPLSQEVEQKPQFTSIASPEAAEKQDTHLKSPCHETDLKEVELTNISCDREAEYEHEVATTSSADEDVEQVFVEEKETQTCLLEGSNVDSVEILSENCKILIGRPRSILSVHTSGEDNMDHPISYSYGGYSDQEERSQSQQCYVSEPNIAHTVSQQLPHRYESDNDQPQDMTQRWNYSESQSCSENVRFYYQRFRDSEYDASAFHPSQIGITQPDDCSYPNIQPNNINILYAAAMARAERNDDESGPPVKIRLLCAEALGVHQGSEPSDQHLFYTATRPNQEIQNLSSPAFSLAPPAVIHPSSGDENPLVSLFQYTHNQNAPLTQMASQYPVQVSYSNGVTHIQTITDHPDRSRLIERAREARNALPEDLSHFRQQWSIPESFSSPICAPHPSNPMENSYNCHNNIAPMSDSRDDLNRQQPSSESPLRRLATEATRRLGVSNNNDTYNDGYDAAIAAAAAIAAVGEAARKRREEEQLRREERRLEMEAREFLEQQRQQQLRRPMTGGPRKNYLSNPSNYQD